MRVDKNRYEIIVIGSSAGGMNLLPKILSGIHKNFSLPIVIVNHLHPSPDSYFVQLLQNSCSLKVVEAEEKEPIISGTIYTSPPNYHLLIETDKTFSLSTDMKKNYSRPSIDMLFYSASDVYKSHTLGVVLTGANSDGALGAKYIKDNGGDIIVQNPESAYMNIMPQSVLDICNADYILEPEEISYKLNQFAEIKIRNRR